MVDEEVVRKQREAEQRVRRMREENRRLAQQMGACPPEERMPKALPPKEKENGDGGRFLPLLLAVIIYRNRGPMELVLALLYLAL